MRGYLVRKTDGWGGLAWTLITRDPVTARVYVATYTAIPPYTHGPQETLWTLHIDRQFQMHRSTAFKSADELLRFVANRIYEGSGHRFRLTPEDLIRGTSW